MGGNLVFRPTKIMAFVRYVRSLVKAQRVKPEDDGISALARAEEAGHQLSEDELLAMIVLLLVAGHETTVNLIGNGALALLEHPDQLSRLFNDPTLIKSGIEELLRHNGPLETATERYPREDTSVAGVKIPRGELVFAVLASANRDEQQFEHADRLDLGREPNPHVAFGQGVHYCLGAPLARREVRAAWQNFSLGVSGQVLTVREQRCEARCDGTPASGVGIGTPYNRNSVAVQRSARVEIGTRHNARDAGGAERTSGGTQNSVRRPRQGTPSPRPSNFPRGAAAGGDESRAEVSWVRWRGGIFQSARVGSC